MLRRISAVAVNGLSRRYGRRWALANVSFDVPEGAAVMVAGRNGSGKSTLLRVLATAIRPHAGSVRILGDDAALDPQRVREKVALLGHATHLYGQLTALENLQLVARLLRADVRTPALLRRLAEVGLEDRADDLVQTFSAGMQQRLALARLLLQPAELVLLDEPYGHLDAAGFLLVDRVLQQLRAQGTTVLMATHLLRRGRKLCNRALVLDLGRVAYSGPASEMPAPAGLAEPAFAEGE